jgi:hypothetical protein
MLVEFTAEEHAAAIDAARDAAIPGDVPEWVDDVQACPRCQNSGEECDYCGHCNADYGNQAEPLPIASVVSQ